MKPDKKTKKRVDVIAKYIYPIAGGIETNIMQTYTVLKDKFGWDVTIHVTANSYLEKNIFPPEETINNLKIRRYPSGLFGFSPSIDWDNADVIALHNFDVFFVRFLFKTYLLKLFGKKKFALMLTPHGGFNPEWSTFKPIVREIKKLYTYTLGAWLINAATDGMRAVSEWEYKETTKYIIPAKVRVIDNGLEDEAYVDVDKFASEEIKRAVEGYGRYVIQIGRVYPIKNYETTIESLQFIPNDVKFVIVGPLQDEAYERQLFELIKKLKLENRVVFTGVCRGVDKYYLMRHAIAMVHMALWESYGNVLREGMSQGLICITSDVYNMPLLVNDGINGFCLPVHDSRKVAEKISWIIDLKNASRVEQMKKENILLGKDQSWKEVAGKMDLFYREALLKI